MIREEDRGTSDESRAKLYLRGCFSKLSRPLIGPLRTGRSEAVLVHSVEPGGPTFPSSKNFPQISPQKNSLKRLLVSQPKLKILPKVFEIGRDQDVACITKHPINQSFIHSTEI